MKKKIERRFVAVVIAFMLAFSCNGSFRAFAEETDHDNSEQAQIATDPDEDEPLRDNPATIPGQWIYNNTVGKWWYRHTDGTFTSNDWEYISDAWYHFDAAGWMQTGWLYDNSHWYYLNPSNGAMVTGWKQIDNNWYYFKSNGQMVTGWRQISNAVGTYWYFFKTNGQMVTGWKTITGYTYFFNSLGQMVTGWKTITGYSYFFNSNGQLQDTTRRAIVIANSDSSNEAELNGWQNCLSDMTFYQDSQFVRIEKRSAPSYEVFCDLIDDVMSDANESDITYLCLSCHGSSSGLLRLCSDSYVTGQMLHALLDSYNGKVILFLSACYAGTIIDRGQSGNPEDVFLSDFIGDTRSGELANEKYIVLCSSASTEYSFGYKVMYNNAINELDIATHCWTRGGGWDIHANQPAQMYADIDHNSIVTLSELYSYSTNHLFDGLENYVNTNNIEQHVAVYSADNNFTIFEKQSER
ncbi:MAG: hypothetical protein K5897_11245 [Eubacterium sp.]|nr:hypothetical protein [Eubacterium sp.]